MRVTFIVATASVCSVPGDVNTNLKKISALAETAAKNGCKFLLTPEMSASGYSGYPEVLATAEIAGEGAVYRGLCEIARKNDMIVTAGFVEKNGEKKHVSHYIVYPDGTYRVTRKHRVTPAEFPLDPAVRLYYDDTEEIGHVYEGEEQFTVFEIDGVKCSIVICADWGIKKLFDKLQKLGVRLVLLVTGAGGTRDSRFSLQDIKNPDKKEIRDKYFKEMQHCSPDGMMFECIDRNISFACCNLAGFDGHKYYHGGSSKIINCNGELVSTVAGIPVIEEMRDTLGFGEVFFEW